MKEATEKIQVRVSGEVASFLRAKAAESGMPLTELGGALLSYAAQAEANEVGEALVLPTVRQVVRQELQQFLERTFDFQVRTYMEAGTARRMVQAAMHYETPMSVERIKAIEEKQWSQTWAASRKHFDELTTLDEVYRQSAGVHANKQQMLHQFVNADEQGLEECP